MPCPSVRSGYRALDTVDLPDFPQLFSLDPESMKTAPYVGFYQSHTENDALKQARYFLSGTLISRSLQRSSLFSFHFIVAVWRFPFPSVGELQRHN
ncbi:hypothetical protein RRG08_062478 [Elysia crispata]|uniref:Uncharacterized protein n=1 Tax=Elysia crispata TaxID=231223 RepID=A0AAE1D561_9GAST|nr:hypothetical protein RRG08_062478 [Elysia crispata]